MTSSNIGNDARRRFSPDAADRLATQLGGKGLISVCLTDDGGLRMRSEANLPWVRTRGAEAFAEWVDVYIALTEGGLVFRLEHPEPGTVLHPNWDGNGFWRLKRAVEICRGGEAALPEAAALMIGSLKMQSGCYALNEPVNRNAVSWCYAHGKVPIRIVRVNKPLEWKERAEDGPKIRLVPSAKYSGAERDQGED